MKKSISVALACGLILMVGAIASSQVAAKTDDHKIVRKFDLSGSFAGLATYNWPGVAPEATWQYRIHIKEASDGDYSVGSIHFRSGNISVIGRVKMTKYDYWYWKQWDLSLNLLACGTTNYKAQRYFFMFLYAEGAMWFALSETSYEGFLDEPDGPKWWPRAYELHSGTDVASIPWNSKEIPPVK